MAQMSTTHPGVKNTIKRVGNLAVSGKYRVEYPLIRETINRLKETIERTGAKKISAMMLASNPLNRAHERMIRQAVVDSDLLVLFLRKPFISDDVSFEDEIQYFKYVVENFFLKIGGYYFYHLRTLIYLLVIMS